LCLITPLSDFLQLINAIPLNWLITLGKDDLLKTESLRFGSCGKFYILVEFGNFKAFLNQYLMLHQFPSPFFFAVLEIA
jgi:hypothetical protein